MEKKQTAVEWLIKQLQPTISIRLSDVYIKELIDKAIAIEKEQIIDAFEIGYDNGACVQEDESIYHGNNYYSKTFKKD